VNKAVAQMDQVTQSTAARTEELSSTAQTLSHQAAELQQLVGRFRTRATEASMAADGTVAASSNKAGLATPAVDRHLRQGVRRPAPVSTGARAAGRAAVAKGDGFEEF
jgi:methyl-accepting chemotaxis protein